ncbi:hypothetical protein WH47_10911 [Habropoda laboriosa]|uniref:Uncharacterized protein n=1 Tax=Habropoda laboriosa TaxID=597456 RepID=A0A0L7QML3_9HYME|nr:hypothetical protein WH47_10911 [Habropoda laboriosa]
MYQHNYKTLPPNVLEAIKPVYKDLNAETLLECCVGAYIQNKNGSVNNLIWKISLKEIYPGSTIFEIAANK